MRLLHLFEEEKMKISEVHMQEAEPNYETNPAQARLAAIAVKLMDKAETTSDESLQIALSRVATHLPEYGTAFGAKNMQELLDIINGEGRYAPDPDMPQDNKNPIKVSKESLMKMMAYGQKMVDKEGTVKVDVKEAETTVKGKPYSAYRAKAQLRELSEARRMLENEIIKLADLDNGDLTDQLTTMFNANTRMSGAIRRAYAIIPDDPRDHMADPREGVGESSFGDRSLAARQMKSDSKDVTMMVGNIDDPASVARTMNNAHRSPSFKGIKFNAKPAGSNSIKVSGPEGKIKDFIKMATGSATFKMVEAAIPTSEYDYDLVKFHKKVEELEDQNQHGEVAEMLVNLYGNDAESMVIRGINGMHSKQGSITRSQQTLRDEIATPYYKKLEKEVAELKRTSPAYTMRNEGVISDLFKASTAEKRNKQATISAYDAMRLEKETKKFAKQGLSPEDARKYAYRKVYGKPVQESKLPMGKIHKAVDDGKSMDAIVGMFANKGTTNTDDIRKAVKDYKFKSRMKK